MAQVPSNLIPTRVTQLQYAPTASEDSLLLIVYDGTSYKIRAGDLLAVAGVPTSRQVIAGTGLTGGGQLTSNVTLSIANGGVGPTQLAVTGVTAGAYGSSTQIPVLTVDATGRVTAASFVTPSISNLSGGAANRIAYQTAPNTTGFITAPTVSNTVLEWNGTSFVWSPAATGAVSSVTASLPISSSGGTTPNISIPQATGSVSGYLSSSDWSTFNNKQEGLTLTTTGTSGPATLVGGVLNIPNYNPGSSSVTSVTATSPVVSTGGSTPNISMAAANATTNGYLTSTDWNTFNNKAPATSGSSILYGDGAGGFSNVTIGSGVSFAGGTLSATGSGGTVTSVSGTGTVNGLTLTGTVTGSGSLTLGGTLSNVDLTSQVTGTLPVTNGGTGVTTLTGYVKGSGTSAFTASSTIPNTDVTGLGTMSTQNASSVTISGGTINGTTIGASSPAAGTFTSATLTSGTISTTPSGANDIVNKAYADSIATGVNYHPAVQYATAATLTSTSGSYTYNNGTGGVGATITGPVNTALIIDGHTMVAGDVTAGTRVLIKDETGAYVNTTTPSAAFNGAYVVTQIATVSVGWVLTRATDYDSSGSGINEIDQGDFFYVVYGTANTNTSWVQQTPLPITVGTTQLILVQFGTANVYTAGTGLTLSGSNQFSITNTGVTANTYGSASAVPVLTTNAQGQLTGVTNTNIAIDTSQITSGTLAINRGGTASNATPTAGTVAYGTGTAYAFTAAGTAGQVLTSNGASAPTWTTPTTGTVTSVTATSPVASTGGTTPVISMPAATTSVSGYLTSTDWTTFNSKAPATSGTSILYGNGSGGFSNVTIGSGISFAGGTLSATGSGGTITGSGTTNYVPKFSSSTALSNSLIYDDGTNVGIGTSTPSAKLQVTNGNILLSNAYYLSARNNANTLSLSLIGRNTSDQVLIDPDGYGTLIGSGGALNLNSSGNLGLGVTPSAWATLTGFDINTWGAVSAYTNQVVLSGNAYHNSGWKYKQSGAIASRYEQNSTTPHAWYTAPSGTAGNAISFTQAMTLDSSGNLGIGTSTPANGLLNIGTNGSQAGIAINAGSQATYGYLSLSHYTNGAFISTYAGSNTASDVLRFGTTSTERMRIDSSGNLGLGVTPSAWATNRKTLQIGGLASAVLALNGTSAVSEMYFNSYLNTSAVNTYAANGYAGLFDFNSSTAGGFVWKLATSGTAGNAISFTQAMTLDSSGNLGLGVTPSAWSTGRAMELGAVGNALWGYSGNIILSQNTAGYSGGFIYATSGNAAARYQQSAGTHAWYTAPSGTAGNAISFTQTATLDSSGLMIGRTSRQNNGTIEALGTGQQAFVAQVTNNGNSTFQGFNAAGAATFYTTGNGDTYLYSINTLGTGALPISVNSAERMRIDSSGNVGIGTSSPGSKLDLSNGHFRLTTAYQVAWYNGSTQLGSVLIDSGSNLTFQTGSSNTERMRIDSSGNVGIGTSSPSTKLDVSVTRSYGQSADVGIAIGGTDNGYVDNGTASSWRQYVSGSNTGQSLKFDAFLRGTGWTERMRISSTGGLSVGTTADPGTGAIYATGNITAYYSDDRLKTRKGNIENALEKVLSLDGFHYEANETAQALGYKAKPEVGLSAQQVQAVLPDVVVPAPIDEQYLTVHYERLIPLLVEAIKEQQTLINQLTTRIAVLEAK